MSEWRLSELERRTKELERKFEHLNQGVGCWVMGTLLALTAASLIVAIWR